MKCPNCSEDIKTVRCIASAQASYIYTPGIGDGPEAFGPWQLEEGSHGDVYEYACPKCNEDLPESFVDRLQLPEYTYTFTVTVRARDEDRAENVRDYVRRVIADIEAVDRILIDGEDPDDL